jgi:hypothetical protein
LLYLLDEFIPLSLYSDLFCLFYSFHLKYFGWYKYKYNFPCSFNLHLHGNLLPSLHFQCIYVLISGVSILQIACKELEKGQQDQKYGLSARSWVQILEPSLEKRKTISPTLAEGRKLQSSEKNTLIKENNRKKSMKLKGGYFWKDKQSQQPLSCTN